MIDWNLATLMFFYAHRTAEGVSFFSKVSEFGGVAIVVAVAIFSAAIASRGRYWAHALGMLVALGGAIATTLALKNILRFERPDAILQAVTETSFSFPSSHATAAMALYGFLAWCAWEKWPRWRPVTATVFGILILGIGVSRLYLGVHWPIDVIAGYLVGAVFVWIGVRVTKRLEAFEK